MRNSEQHSDRLLWLGWKLRGIGYLIAHHNDDGAPPLDHDVIWHGVGEILEEISLDMQILSKELEGSEIKAIKRKRTAKRSRS